MLQVEHFSLFLHVVRTLGIDPVEQLGASSPGNRQIYAPANIFLFRETEFPFRG